MALSEKHYPQAKKSLDSQRLVAFPFGAKMLTQDFKVYDIGVTHLGNRKLVIRSDIKVTIASMIKVRAVVLIDGVKNQVDFIGKVASCILKEDSYRVQLNLTYACKAGESLLSKVSG